MDTNVLMLRLVVNNVLNIQDFPDYEYEHYDPKIGFTVDSDYMLVPIVLVTCDAKRGDLEGQKDVFVHKRR